MSLEQGQAQPYSHEFYEAGVRAQDRKSASCLAMLTHSWVPDKVAVELHVKSVKPYENLTPEEQQTLSAAHLHRTFLVSEEAVPAVPAEDDIVLEATAVAWADRRSQKLFRELCLLQRGGDVEAVIDAEIARASDRTIRRYVPCLLGRLGRFVCKMCRACTSLHNMLSKGTRVQRILKRGHCFKDRHNCKHALRVFKFAECPGAPRSRFCNQHV